MDFCFFSITNQTVHIVRLLNLYNFLVHVGLQFFFIILEFLKVYLYDNRYTGITNNTHHG